MPVQVDRWERGAPPSAAEARARLGAAAMPERWSNGPGDVYAVHAHPYRKVLVVVRGAIRFTLPDEGQAVDLRAGDRMVLPAGVRHGAVVGAEGVVCLEAHEAASRASR
jgi:quercetin dioxygenase-like cupin family protein